MALSIAEKNPNVWIVRDTVPETYGAEVVPAKGNEYLMTQWLGYDIEPEWKWKPSNPYLFISGALEINEWRFFLKSNRNALFYVGLAILALLLNEWVWRTFLSPKRKVIVEVQEETINPETSNR